MGKQNRDEYHALDTSAESVPAGGALTPQAEIPAPALSQVARDLAEESLRRGDYASHGHLHALEMELQSLKRRFGEAAKHLHGSAQRFAIQAQQVL